MERRMTTRQEEQNKISHSFHKTSQRMRLNPRQSMKWKKRQRNPRAQQQNIIMRTSWEAKVNRGDHTESITWSITIVILFFDILRKQTHKAYPFDVILLILSCLDKRCWMTCHGIFSSLVSSHSTDDKDERDNRFISFERLHSRLKSFHDENFSRWSWTRINAASYISRETTLHRAFLMIATFHERVKDKGLTNYTIT